ncbi:MAG: transposase zinc-binding domain-containing protein [Planctomycetota bacterium]
MGEHEWRCDACGQTYVYFNSCGNRHCPACREAYRQQWAQKLEQDLPPIPYHHLMLTLPRPLTRVVMAHGDAFYSLFSTDADRWALDSHRGRAVARRPARRPLRCCTSPV